MNLHRAVLVALLISLIVTANTTAQIAPPLTKVVMTIGALSEREGVVYVAQVEDFFASMGSISLSCRCATTRSASPR